MFLVFVFLALIGNINLIENSLEVTKNASSRDLGSPNVYLSSSGSRVSSVYFHYGKRKKKCVKVHATKGTFLALPNDG